jgi:F0F1-type ATP synthase assembly protein I
MDGSADRDTWIADCVKKKLDAIPAGTNFIIDPAIGVKIECAKSWDNKNAQTSSSDKTSLSNNAPIIVGAIVGAVAGYFVAKSEKVSLIGGVLIGGGAIAGVMMLLNPSEK